MNLTLAVGMEQHQVSRSVVLVVAVPMMQFNVLIALDHLPTDRAKPALLFQEQSHETLKTLAGPAPGRGPGSTPPRRD
jgi:hypothetical protein